MTTVVEIVLKAAVGGTFVLLFALLAETLTPKRFAGIFAAAPSVALASLLMTVAFKGPLDARRACVGMIAGAVGFVAYCCVTPASLRRFGTVRGAALALLAWAVVAAALFPAVAAAPAAKASSGAFAVSRHRRLRRPALQCQPSKVRETKPKDGAVRFAFGAGTSTVAGVISALAGPVVGGIFLAFPAILLASLTLVADEEGQAAARDDARGATAGAFGLIAFALVGGALFHRWPTAWAFGIAASAWAVVSAGCYGGAWLAGLGADEPQ
jgi:uncharacterized membrane protein (GlpM family)